MLFFLLSVECLIDDQNRPELVNDQNNEQQQRL